MADFTPSVSTTLFRESAEHLAGRLGQNGGASALEMAGEARALAERFRSWELSPPTREDRVASIQQLFDLNRRAMDFLSSRTSSIPPQRR